MEKEIILKGSVGVISLDKKDFRVSAAWPFGRLKANINSLTIYAFNKHFSIAKEEIIRLELIKFPFPSLRIIKNSNGNLQELTFQVLSKKRLLNIIQEFNYPFDGEFWTNSLKRIPEPSTARER